MIPIYKPYLIENSKKYVDDAIDSTWISSSGKYLDLVQDKLKELLGIKYVLLNSNGTCATHLVAKSLIYKFPSIKEIIVPNNVYIAAINSFLFDNFFDLKVIDSNSKTWNMDLDLLEKRKKKKAILIVHNIGNIINVPELKRKYQDVIFVEDNCEGFLGKYENKYSGTESLASSISFFGNKNITCGEGGAFLTNDEDIFEHAKCIHGQGQSEEKFIHSNLGYNYRMTNVQAAILYGQLQYLNEIQEKKQIIFDKYKSFFANKEDFRIQLESKDTKPSNWLFGVRWKKNPGYFFIKNFFDKRGIETRPMFYPLSYHKFLRNYKINIGDETVAKKINKECFILPSYPSLSDDEINHIFKSLEELCQLK